jgi:DNA-binding MarR family transcriptional regulator
LKHSVIFDEGGNFLFVEVRKEHVEQAKTFIEEMIQNLDYDAFVFKNKEQTDLTKEEFQEIVEELDETEINILRQLVNGPKKSPELASILGMSDRSVKEHYKILRKFNLILTSQGFGVKLTTKGIVFLKMLDNQQKSKQDDARDKQNQENQKEGVYGGRSEVVKSGEAKNKEKTSLLFTSSPQSRYTPSDEKDVSRDKSQSKPISGKSTDMSEDITYWQKLERDIIDTIKNPPIGKCVHDFEIINFVKQRDYVKHESDIVKVLEKLLRDGIVIRTPDGSFDINWSKWRGGD